MHDDSQAKQKKDGMYSEEVPAFLNDDPEEAVAFQKVQMLGLVLSKDADKQLSQEDVRTYVLSKMVDMPDEPNSEEPQSPGSLIAHGLSPRLNVVFDVDHTLIYACDRKESRVLPGTVKNTHLLRLNSGFEMMLVVREGIYEMFEFLEPFCTFYVYSHGLKEYIDKIL